MHTVGIWLVALAALAGCGVGLFARRHDNELTGKYAWLGAVMSGLYGMALVGTMLADSAIYFVLFMLVMIGVLLFGFAPLKKKIAGRGRR